MSEAQLLAAIRLELGKDPRVVLWRNNVGKCMQNNQMVAYGVGGVGGADLIGIAYGVPIAIEVKTPTGRVSPEQAQFLQLVRDKGGIAGVARSVDDALRLVEDAKNSLTRKPGKAKVNV